MEHIRRNLAILPKKALYAVFGSPVVVGVFYLLIAIFSKASPALVIEGLLAAAAAGALTGTATLFFIGRTLQPYMESHSDALDKGPSNASHIEKLLDGLGAYREELAGVGRNITASLHDIEAREKGLFDMLKQVSASTETQLVQLGMTTDEIKQISTTIDGISNDTGELVEYSRVVSGAATSGNDAIDKVQAGMGSIYEKVDESAQKIQSLGKSSESIGEIISVISAIAEQTNLLALNAAIEAARAGEQGRGFAVVADEVRKLAERTTAATKEIATMIRTVQGEIAEVVGSIEYIVHGVETGKDLSTRAGESFKRVNNGVAEMNGRISSIAASANQQLDQSKDMSAKMEIILAEARKIAIGIENAWDSMGDLIETIKKVAQLGGACNNH